MHKLREVAEAQGFVQLEQESKKGSSHDNFFDLTNIETLESVAPTICELFRAKASSFPTEIRFAQHT